MDACIKGLGGMLKEVFVILYESWKLKKHEKNYATRDLEFADIVHPLKMWRHYLLRRRFELRMDHMSLMYLFDQQR